MSYYNEISRQRFDEISAGVTLRRFLPITATMNFGEEENTPITIYLEKVGDSRMQPYLLRTIADNLEARAGAITYTSHTGIWCDLPSDPTFAQDLMSESLVKKAITSDGRVFVAVDDLREEWWFGYGVKQGQRLERNEL